MSFPYLMQETFDDGTRGNFDSEVDAGSVLDFPSYKELSRFGLSPWQGAHALRVRLSGANDAYVEEGNAITGQSPVSLWFPLLVGADVTLDDGDRVNVLEVRSSDPVPEAFIAVRRTGTNYELVAGEGANVLRNYGTITRSNSRWYQIELTYSFSVGTMLIDWYVDGGQVGSQFTSAVSPLSMIRIGAPSGTSANDAGTILVGGIIADDARIFPRLRFAAETVWVTRDITAYLGNGTIDAVNFTSTGTDGVLSILDVDVFESGIATFSREPIVYLRNTEVNAQVPGQNLPVSFRKGIYVQLTGTNPQAWISLKDGGSGIVRSQSNYIDKAFKS